MHVVSVQYFDYFLSLFLLCELGIFWYEMLSKAAFTWIQLAYVSEFAYMHILHTGAKVFFTLHSHGFMEAGVSLSKIGNCCLKINTLQISLK